MAKHSLPPLDAGAHAGLHEHKYTLVGTIEQGGEADVYPGKTGSRPPCGSQRGLLGAEQAERLEAPGHFFARACGQSGSFIRISMARAISQYIVETCITSYASWKAARAPARSPAPSRFQPIR